MRRAWVGRSPEVLIVVVAVALTTIGLHTPGEVYFDEVYYVAEARGLLDPAAATRTSVHPPVGTWLIAAGMSLVGDTPVGWRLMGASAGVLTVWLTYRLVLTITARQAPAVLAALLLALDGVFLTQARIAMLDIYLVMFVVSGIWLFLLDRGRRTAPEVDGAPAGPAALVGAGSVLGLAVATKWSGVFALAVVGLLAVAFEIGALRRRHAPPAATRRAAIGLALCLGVLPGVIYAASWTPWLVASEQGIEAREDRGAAGALFEHHRELLDFHLGLEATHRYRASAATWPVQSRPVVLRWERCARDGSDRDGQPCEEPGVGREILALGNLGLWWVGLLSLPVLAGSAARRDWRGATLLALLAGQYVPWLLTGRPVFAFYAVVLAPVLAAATAFATTELDAPRRWRGLLLGATLGGIAGVMAATLAGVVSAPRVLWALAGTMVGAAIGAIRDRRHEPVAAADGRVGSVVRGGVAVLAIGLFVYFAPLWFGLPMDLDAIERRWWFESWI